MQSYIKYCLAVVLLFLFFSCSDKNQKGTAELDGYQLIVVSHTIDGKLLDYMAFNDLSEIRMIRINPKKGYKDINVTLFGSKRHEALQKDAAVISKDETGYKGCVEVSIKDGIAIGSMGNGAHWPSPITESTIDEVNNALAAGRLKSGTKAPFEIIK